MNSWKYQEFLKRLLVIIVINIGIMSKKPAFIIVIGTSAGGIKVIEKIVGQFNPDMDAAIFVVHHLSKSNGEEFLVERFQKATALKCELGKEGTKIKKGTIYIAPPNEHLLVKEDHIVLGHGPEENRWRPSIDVLFRSAAAAYNTRVIGIILTRSEERRVGKECGSRSWAEDEEEEY